MTASRSISTASTTAPTSWASRSTRRAPGGSTSTARRFAGARADIGDDPENPDIHIAWKVLYTAKDTWLGPEQNLGAIGSYYNLTMDPFEKYDMTFNGAVSTRLPTTSPGRYAGYDNGWAISLLSVPIMEFNKSIVDFPNIKRFPGGASNDMNPNLQDPANPLPLMDLKKTVKTIGLGGLAGWFGRKTRRAPGASVRRPTSFHALCRAVTR